MTNGPYLGLETKFRLSVPQGVRLAARASEFPLTLSYATGCARGLCPTHRPTACCVSPPHTAVAWCPVGQ